MGTHAIASKPFDVADLKTWTCGKCDMTFKVGMAAPEARPERHVCPDCGRMFFSSFGGGSIKVNPHAAHVYIDKHPWGYE